ncbi:hypothetical protein EIN_433770, partial [Entamoeba invadens IP1]
SYTQNDREKFGNVIPSSVTSIGDWCFGECSGLSGVTIPSSVRYIGIECFPSDTIVHRN